MTTLHSRLTYSSAAPGSCPGPALSPGVAQYTRSIGRPRSHPLLAATLLGLAGTATLVVGGALSGAASHTSGGRWWSVPTVPVRPSVDALAALCVFYAGLVGLACAWVKLRRDVVANGSSVAAVAVVIAVWVVPLLLGPPLGSRDVYAYAAQGRLADEGFDPYVDGPSALGDDPILQSVDPLYLDAPTVYGPVFIAVSSTVSTASTDLVLVVMAFRALAVLGLLMTAVAVDDIARGLGRDRADALVLTMANPLVLLHLVSGAHNEALMLALLVGGVAVGRRPRLRLVGVGLCAFAAAIKMPAILGVAFVAWPWISGSSTALQRVARAALSGALAFMVIALAGDATGWGWGWVDTLSGAKPVDAYLSLTRLIGWAVQLLTGVDDSEVIALFRIGGLALAAMAAAWLLLRRDHASPRALAGALLLFAVLHPTTQPWYLTWGLILWAASSAGDENRAYIGLCIVAAFAVLPMGPRLGEVVLDDRSALSILMVGIALGAFAVVGLRFSFSSSTAIASSPLVRLQAVEASEYS